MKTKDRILGTVQDLVSNFLYYDRKGDEDLPVGMIDRAVAKGEITIDEIVDAFKSRLDNGLTREFSDEI